MRRKRSSIVSNLLTWLSPIRKNKTIELNPLLTFKPPQRKTQKKGTCRVPGLPFPRGSMYGIWIYIYDNNHLHVGNIPVPWMVWVFFAKPLSCGQKKRHTPQASGQIIIFYNIWNQGDFPGTSATFWGAQNSCFRSRANLTRNNLTPKRSQLQLPKKFQDTQLAAFVGFFGGGKKQGKTILVFPETKRTKNKQVRMDSDSDVFFVDLTTHIWIFRILFTVFVKMCVFTCHPTS